MLKGWIAAIAVNGPDRAAEDALARKLGYTLGKWPLVPLTGSVVEHNPGVLEVYETINAFASSASAQAFFGDILESARQSAAITVTEGGTTKPDPTLFTVTGADGSFATETPQWVDPNLGLGEKYISFSVRMDAYVVQVTIQGGATLNRLQAVSIANNGLKTVATSCQTAQVTLHLG